MPTLTAFETYCKYKEQLAVQAELSGFYTVGSAPSARELVRLGSGWTKALFDGDFLRSAQERAELPVVSLVFVQSRDGNTVADDPSTLGGGDTDKHLIYEGLSRVDADAVLAGAATARSERMVFSVWHPELVNLRQHLGRSRHPAQIVVTNRGALPLERGLMFTEPSLRTFVVTNTSTAAALRARMEARSWVTVIDAGQPVSLTLALSQLRQHGIRVVSAVGGRQIATALFREGLVRDLYLTTSPIEAGEPDTPFCDTPPSDLTRVLEKRGRGQDEGVRFEHFLIGR